MLRQCSSCDEMKQSSEFLPTKVWHYKDKVFPVCTSCLRRHYVELNWDWDAVSLFCQTIDIPFVPAEFERLHEINGDNVLPIYVRMFSEIEYSSLEWKPYYDKYMELLRKNQLELELPTVSDSYYDDLRLRWGMHHEEEALRYMEGLYNGLLASQNVNGDLSRDQAQKLCKISWAIEERIAAGLDFDKLIGSYEKIIKISDFTPKNMRSDSDFSSFGEVYAWLEKRGWINPHLTNLKKDPIDELITNTSAFAQRLYINETGVAEEIEHRIEQLKLAIDLEEKEKSLAEAVLEDENFLELAESGVSLDDYDNEGYDELIIEEVLDADTTSV